MRLNIFDRLSFLSLFLVIFLLPVFILPFTNIPVEVSKGLLLVAGLFAALVFWAIARFFDGRITLPRSAALLAGLGVVLSFFLSALFSQAREVSFFGTIFEVGTFSFVFAGFLLMALGAIVIRNPASARVLLYGLALSSAVVLIFQSLRFFWPDPLSLGLLEGKTGNLLASWNTFGVFAGLSAVMSLYLGEFAGFSGVKKLLLRILVIFSLILVATVNFPLVWALVGIFSLVIFVYKLSMAGIDAGAEEKKYFPVFSFSIIIISLLFFMSGQFIGGILPSRLGIENTEVSPSLGATMDVAGSVLKADPIFGIGPNKWTAAWAKYKSVSINGTQFWDVPFSSGFGLLPTFAATTGALGILAWLAFFVFFILGGVKSLFSAARSSAGWEAMAFFLFSLYLFISSFFYFPGSVVFLLALCFAGVSISLSSANASRGEISITFLDDHRKSFFSILSLVLIIIISSATLFKYVERFASVSYFRKALAAEAVPAAETSIRRSIALYPNDLYYRTYSQISLVKLDSIVGKGASLSDQEKADLQATLNEAVGGAQLAANYDPSNYLNWRTLGLVYQGVALLGIKDANSRAIEVYNTASTLNPVNPGIKLAIANAYFADRKLKDAKEYANLALSLKPDYIEALILLSQIAKTEGDSKSAISYAETALSFAPASKDLGNYVESLKNQSSASSSSSTKTE